MGSIGKTLSKVAGPVGTVIGAVVGGPTGASVGGSIGSAVGSLLGGSSGGRATEKTGNVANGASLAQLAYQQSASEKLLQLLGDPSKVTSMGGYQTGIDAINRSAAGKGLLNSGNIMTALADYGNSFYGDQVRLLAALASGTPGPTVGTNMINSGLGQQTSSMGGLGQLLGQFGGMFGNALGGSSGGGGLSSLLGSGGLGSSNGGYWPFGSVSQTQTPGMDFLSFGGGMNNSSPLYTWDSSTGSIASEGSSFFNFGGF